MPTNPLVDYTHDLAGRRTKRAMNNFTETDTAYDAAGRVILLEQKNAAFTFDRRDYGYNTVNNRTFEKRNGALGDAYAYDATRQVTGVQYDATTPDITPTAPARTVAYAFDATGNRTSVTDNAIDLTPKAGHIKTKVLPFVSLFGLFAALVR